MKFANTSWTNKHYGTSFHGVEVEASVRQLTKVLGTPAYSGNDGEEKTNFEWAGEIEGNPVTVYDWKEYRKVEKSEILSFHIGSKDQKSALQLKKFIEEKLQGIK